MKGRKQNKRNKIQIERKRGVKSKGNEKNDIIYKNILRWINKIGIS